MFDRFGLFVENLYPHGDEIDQEQLLRSWGPYRPNWQYNWSSLNELHYSDCNMYSLLKEGEQRLNDALSNDEVLEVKPGIWGVNLNVKVLITKFCVWWLKRVRRGKKDA